MRSLRRSLPAVVGLLFAGVVVVSGATPALAIPFTSSQGTALVGGTPLIQANCPTTATMPDAGPGTSTNGVVTVTGAGAQCGGGSARAFGVYAIAGGAPVANTPPPGTSTLRFDASCTFVGATNSFIDVPAGTSVNGTVVGAQTVVTAPGAAIIFPGGATGTANVVTGTPETSLTVTALTLGTGQVIGRAVCGGTPYPLAVGAPATGAATPDIALTPVSGGGGSSSNRMLYVGGAVALLIVAQVGVGRIWRRRRDVTGS
jgi:hypothetical protein